MKNKICHITTLHPAKDMRIFQKECVSLAKHGYETHLIVANQKNELDKGVHIHNITSTISGRLKKMRHNPKIALKKALEIDADLYHFHDPELLSVGLQLQKKGKKVIYDTHEDVPRQILSKYYIPKLARPIISKAFEIYENRIAAKMDGIIAATPFIRDRFLKINPRTIDVNNFPILAEFSTPQQEEKIHDICYLGLSSKIRGIVEMVKMLEYTPARLTLVGRFQSEQEEAEVRQLPTWKKVNYLGMKTRAEVSEILSSSKMGIVVFHPEPNHVNAQPNKVFEYMAAGLPFVASDFPFWKKIIEPNEIGLCADPMNPRAIAAAVNTLLENPDLRKKMGANGQHAAQNIFNWKKEEEKLINFYHQILQS